MTVFRKGNHYCCILRRNLRYTRRFAPKDSLEINNSKQRFYQIQHVCQNVPVKQKYYFDIQRRVTAHKTKEGWQNIPHVGPVVALDVNALIDQLEKLKGHPDWTGVRVTLNAAMLKIIAKGIKTSPELNASVEHSMTWGSRQITLYDDVNIAIPMVLACGRT